MHHPHILPNRLHTIPPLCPQAHRDLNTVIHTFERCSKIIILFIFMLDLELGDVAFVGYLILDGLLKTTGSLLHVDALLKEKIGFFEKGSYLLHG